jgi:transcriptional regulator with XRE-family HTH domain
VPTRRIEDPRIAFGLALRNFRLKRGLSQERLAELAQVHRTYIGDVERGKRNIALVNITRLAKALKVTPSELVRAMEDFL